tara:strand:+ start:624 stop:1049 length:426 start_codon:yes stop_codon:yes gene_type:complete
MTGHKLKMRFKLSYEDREDVVVHTELLTNQFVDYKNYDVDDLLDIVPHTEEELIGFTTEWVLREEDNRVFIRQLMNSDESIIRTVDPYDGNEESSDSGYTEEWNLIKIDGDVDTIQDYKELEFTSMQVLDSVEVVEERKVH